jgi:hypothetical protein
VTLTLHKPQANNVGMPMNIFYEVLAMFASIKKGDYQHFNIELDIGIKGLKL